jgi:hypothetical protein
MTPARQEVMLRGEADIALRRNLPNDESSG